MSTVASDYQAVSAYLFGRIDYERTALPSGSSGFKLQIMRELLDRLGNPQADQKIVHVAGTKGKGSTATMVSSILFEAGYSTGLYTSPHLERVEERVCVDGRPCSEQQFVERMQEIIPAVEQMDHAVQAGRLERGPTFFEITTALALLHFARQPVDLTVLEVGLGGRLDSTNVCDPLISVITSISFDHTRILGDTLASIAAEKAGIIKPNIPVVCGVNDPEPLAVIQRVAFERTAPLFRSGSDFWLEHRREGASLTCGQDPSAELLGESFSYFETDRDGGPRQYKNIYVNLLGRHQATNASLAVAVAERLRSRGWPIPEAAIRQGLARVRCPARVEVVSREPTVVIDMAHNVASIGSLVTTLNERIPREKRILIFATSRDKDCGGILRKLLPHFDHVILTRFVDNPRAMPLVRLASIARRLLDELPAGDGQQKPSTNACAEPVSAWETALSMAGPRDLICVCGSIFIAAEIRRLVPPLDRIGTDAACLPAIDG